MHLFWNSEQIQVLLLFCLLLFQPIISTELLNVNI